MIIYVEERLDHHAKVNAAALKDSTHVVTNVIPKGDKALAETYQSFLAQREPNKAPAKPKGTMMQKIRKAPRGSSQPGNVVCDKREIISNETRHHNYNDLLNYKLHNNITYYMPPPSIIQRIICII